MWAAAFRRRRGVELLLEHGALPNAVEVVQFGSCGVALRTSTVCEGDQGRSALHFASDYTDCDPGIVDLLLKAGADLGQPDWKGRRPAEMESLLDEVLEACSVATAGVTSRCAGEGKHVHG